MLFRTFGSGQKKNFERLPLREYRQYGPEITPYLETFHAVFKFDRKCFLHRTLFPKPK